MEAKKGKIAPLVSIITLTRNQEAFIEQAIRSVADQKCSFPFIHIIGLDQSEDETESIVEKCAQNDSRILVVKAEEEERIYYNGYPTGRANFLKCLNAVDTPYIAMCDGDDFWEDENHLQEKLEFLEDNPDFIAAVSDSWILTRDGSRTSYMDKKESWLGVERKTQLDLLDVSSRYYPHTSTWVFRNEIQFDHKFEQYPAADFSIYLSLALRGYIRLFDKKSTVYRVHDKGITSNMRQDDPSAHHAELGQMFVDLLKNANDHQKTLVAKGYRRIMQLYIAKYGWSELGRKAFGIVNRFSRQMGMPFFFIFVNNVSLLGTLIKQALQRALNRTKY